MSYKTEFQSNNSDLQSILNKINALEGGSDVESTFVPTNSGGTTYKSKFGDNNTDLRKMLEYIQSLPDKAYTFTIIGWEGYTYKLKTPSGGWAKYEQFGAVWVFTLTETGYYVPYDTHTGSEVPMAPVNITTLQNIYHIVPTTLGYTSIDTGYTHGIEWKKANMALDSFYMKDPFIMLADGIYFMYGSNLWSPDLGNAGFSCYISSDQENWLGPYDLTSGAVDWTGYEYFWSPELVHPNDWYYMAVCCKRIDPDPENPTEKTHVKILASQSPLGKFYDVTNQIGGDLSLPILTTIDGVPGYYELTPLDPHFWRDANVNLFWCNSGNHDEGEADAIYTSVLDLNDVRTKTAPYKTFNASQISWGDGYVCCSPFVLPDQVSGKAVMLFGARTAAGDRVIGQAYANTIAGPWTVIDTPLVSGDVGSPCIFYTKDGTMMLSYHNNATNDPNQRTEIVQVEQAGANPWIQIFGAAAVFYYKGIAYPFEAGMTWQEYIDSEYNTAGFWIMGASQSLVLSPEGDNVCNVDNEQVYPTDVIIENYDYIPLEDELL